MVEPSTFRTTIDFFVRLGVYDVILPFLLVFTIVFAILEKTRVFGSEEYEGKKVSRKNLNAMTSFCIAFFVILSEQLVSIISETMGNVVLLLLVSVSFLLLVGTFMKESEEGVFLEGKWKALFMIIMFLGVALIFLHAIPTEDGDSNWLEHSMDFISDNWQEEWVASLLLIGFIVLVMYWIIGPTNPKKVEKK